MTMSISSSRYLCNLIKWLPLSHQNYFINAIVWMGGKNMHYWKENSLVKMKKKEQLFWEWFGVDTTIWPSMKRNSKAKFFGNQKWRTSLLSCPSSSKPTYGTELFTHSPFIIQSDRRDNVRICSQTTSNFLTQASRRLYNNPNLLKSIHNDNHMTSRC